MKYCFVAFFYYFHQFLSENLKIIMTMNFSSLGTPQFHQNHQGDPQILFKSFTFYLVY